VTTIQEQFEQTQLAEAAYSTFTDPKTGVLYTNTADIQTALEEDGFSATQASEFVNNWSVVDQYTTPSILGMTGTGFSATLFEKLDNGNPTGEFSLSIRGSKEPVDFDADLNLMVTDGIAVQQLVDMYNYWKSLTN